MTAFWSKMTKNAQKDIAILPANGRDNTKEYNPVRVYTRLGCISQSIARERARKIASKNRSSTTTGIGGSFQLANSAPPLGVTGSASAPTARMPAPGLRDLGDPGANS